MLLPLTDEMYEISPYATFSVSGGRTHVGGGDGHQAKTPSRGGGVTASTLDYTVQFKTFGHPDGDNLNATAYPIMPSGHVKGKSSWHKQRYINTDGKNILCFIKNSINAEYIFFLGLVFAFLGAYCSPSIEITIINIRSLL